MIIGVGTDIIEINRIERAVNRGNFIDRVYREKERECLSGKNIESYAGYFACKEAVTKCLGTGFSGFKFNDIEIIKVEGIPSVRLHGEALNIMKKKNIKRIHVSISHCKDYATAVAVAEG